MPYSSLVMRHDIMLRSAAAVVRPLVAILLAVVSLQMVTAKDGPPATDIRIKIKQPLSAGRTYEITCTADGWETPPHISWWIGSRQLMNFTQQVYEDVKKSESTLQLTPTPSDNWKNLTCRAENANGFMNESAFLNVYYAPIVSTRLPVETVFEEGATIYFSCRIEANPKSYLGMWQYKGVRFEHNPCVGVNCQRPAIAIVEKIRREEAGNYTCMAANIEGETTSTPLQLHVTHKPVCRGTRVGVYVVPRGETVTLVCDVDSLPPVEVYRWIFNGTTSDGEHGLEFWDGYSRRNYKLRVDKDYGSFYCYARNVLGQQEAPCVYHIVPPEMPPSPNCSVTNRTSQSVEVRCAARIDGGHQQSFLLEVFDVTSGDCLYNQTKPDGAFLVDDLASGKRLHLRITAFTISGRRQRLMLAATTLSDQVQAEVRERLSNCSMLNRTSQSVLMVCLGGFDDDRTQSILTDVFDDTADHLFRRTAHSNRPAMVHELAIRQDRRIRMLADSVNGQVTAVLLDTPLHDYREVTLLEPQSTRIMLRERCMEVGETVEVSCRTTGSQPAAYVTWWLNDERLYDVTELQVSADGSETLSTVQLTIQLIHERGTITCRATNPYVPTSAQEHAVRLHVCYPPVVSLYLERPLRTDDIQEGDTVTFKCHVQSNPPTWRVKWFFQDRVVQEVFSNETLIDTLTLIVSNIKRNGAGYFYCLASNAIGDTASTPLRLTVKHKPICRWQVPQVYALSVGEEVQLECEVDAIPSPRDYRWMFNSSMEVDGMTLSLVQWWGSAPHRIHKPVNDMSYGTYYCWVYNAVGPQKEPCVFHIVPPGRPNSPSNCSLLNKTERSFVVQCPTATDNGRRQTYHLEVFDVRTGIVVFNQTQQSSVILVNGMWPDRPMTMRIAAVSARGYSQWVRLDNVVLPWPPTGPGPLDEFKIGRIPYPKCGASNKTQTCPPARERRL